jgi:predicted nicotinamide N-methyase
MSSAHIRTAHGILIFGQGHPVIRSLRKNTQGPTLHGTQIWQSSYAIMEYLEDHPLPPGTRIMEIGCGWGALGTFCAKRFGADVLLTDADSNVFPYADAHGQLNGVQMRTERQQLEHISAARLSEQQLILGGDICFWPDLARQLQRLIQRALANGVQQILLADPGRKTFMQLADHCQDWYGAELLPWRLGKKTKAKGHLLVIHNRLRARPA